MNLGIYEQIINKLFRNKLDALDKKQYFIGDKAITAANAADYLSHYLLQIIQQAITLLQVDDDGVEESIDLVNTIIKLLIEDFELKDFEDNIVDAEAKILTAVVDKTNNDYPDIAAHIRDITPQTLLTKSALFTGGNNSISMVSELKKEIQSSNEICWVVSFIKQSGLRLILNDLREFTEAGNKLRVITTTYMGASDFEAVKTLASLPNTEVRVSYSWEEERLHAKTYLFLRNTGFNTAYIGSSNLSGAAITSGVEWNVKVTQMELPNIISSIHKKFDAYWRDDAFEAFDEAKFKKSLNHADDGAEIDFSSLDLMKAKDYQNEVLERLQVERDVHHHYRNLVVAATGTGKTVISAFDYKRFKDTHERANLLFVAHRQEILKQSRDTFRQVLQDENFGDLWYGGHEPQQYNYLFASKDTLNNRLDELNLTPDYFDYIIIDEVHHVAADSYRKILSTFTPQILLGLTATPERMDGTDITQDFDGTISAEIRLTDALNNNLLSPFRYFGISDNVDLRDVKWHNGRYDSDELTKIYTANDRRTSVIFNSIMKYLPNYKDARALCFCVSKEHAELMKSQFVMSHLKADSLTSDDDERHRKQVVKDLKNKKINYLFVVDIFNEGVDIPAVDTVLFLRPTESLTIFLQQFGRGLRKCEGKEYLTVLDFVGQSRAEFNYLDRFRALMGPTSMGVSEEIKKGFPHLPLNCYIELEREAKQYILENIDNYIKSFTRNRIIDSIRRFEQNYDVPLTLSNFVKMTKIPLDKIYRGNRTWAELCAIAGKDVEPSPTHHTELGRAVYKKWLTTDSYRYFSFIARLADSGFSITESSLSEKEKTMALMLYYDLFQEANRYVSLQSMFDDLAVDGSFVSELQQVVHILMDQCEMPEREDNSSLRMISPLMLHAQYTKDQIEVALRTSTLTKKSSCREGVERNHNLNVEAMYVDIIKDREVGSSTDYNDYAMARDMFHWETQNKVSPESNAGQNYINGTQTMLLFVRRQSDYPEDKSRTMGFIYLGEATYVCSEGSRPMEIVWKLKTPMPASVYTFAEERAANGL
jgi:superfamily II DNA or RNA helicase/HKD family nuclease